MTEEVTVAEVIQGDTEEIPLGGAPVAPVSLRYQEGDTTTILRLDQLVAVSVQPGEDPDTWDLVGRLAYTSKYQPVINKNAPETDYDRAVSTAIEIVRLAHGALR